MATLIFAGLSRMAGISKKSGNPYSMPRCVVLLPSESRKTDNFELTSNGLRAVELPVSDECFPRLQQFFVEKFKGLPVPLDCQTSMDSEGKTMIVGVA